MPIYEFKCPKCAVLTEIMIPYKHVSDRQYCTQCNDKTELERVLFSKTAPPQFYGSGFYDTDYKRKKGTPE